jgi:hypothetical protein
MTEQTNHPGSGPDCVICVVRALTEGTPKIWTPSTAGQAVTGVVLKLDEHPVPFAPDGKVPAMDLWLGGLERVRVVALGTTLMKGIEEAAPAVGDRLRVTYFGLGTIPPRGLFTEARTYRKFTVEVSRGHH